MPFAALLPRNSRLLLLLGVLSGALAGCGFQLRGTSPVPAAMQPLAVECRGSMPRDFCQSLREQLRLGGIALVSAEQADYLLALSDYRQDKRASAITPRASAAEYILRHTVALELSTRDRIPLIARTDIHTSESYRYDEDNVLAKQREEDELQQQLSKDLARQVIFRLAPMSGERINALVKDYRSNPPGTELP